MAEKEFKLVELSVIENESVGSIQPPSIMGYSAVYPVGCKTRLVLRAPRRPSGPPKNGDRVVVLFGLSRVVDPCPFGL